MRIVKLERGNSELETHVSIQLVIEKGRLGFKQKYMLCAKEKG
ncbi:hypothetical protein [Planococcus sp. PAMC 21323]|nr:hypothetical protein [Planococcus sp. PAMC 21323]